MSRPNGSTGSTSSGPPSSGPGDPIVLPTVSDMVDYEGELALVIGRRCQHVPADPGPRGGGGLHRHQRRERRDWQWRTPTFTMGKSFDSHAPLGPELVTGDELGDPGALRIRTWVNDELRQDSSTADMIFDCAQMIEYLTDGVPARAGHDHRHRTPAGVGARFDPPRSWLTVTPCVSRSKGSASCRIPSCRERRPSQSASTIPLRGAPALSCCLAAWRETLARLDMTWSAKIGVSCTKKRNRLLSMTASLESAIAVAVALRVTCRPTPSRRRSRRGRPPRSGRRAGAVRPGPRRRRTSLLRWSLPRRSPSPRGRPSCRWQP